MMSQRIGEQTLVNEKVTFENLLGYFMQDNPVKFESSHKKRPLLYPIEIMGLGKTKQLVFFSGNVNVIMYSGPRKTDS